MADFFWRTFSPFSFKFLFQVNICILRVHHQRLSFVPNLIMCASTPSRFCCCYLGGMQFCIGIVLTKARIMPSSVSWCEHFYIVSWHKKLDENQRLSIQFVVMMMRCSTWNRASYHLLSADSFVIHFDEEGPYIIERGALIPLSNFIKFCFHEFHITGFYLYDIFSFVFIL